MTKETDHELIKVIPLKPFANDAFPAVRDTPVCSTFDNIFFEGTRLVGREAANGGQGPPEPETRPGRGGPATVLFRDDSSKN